jgi:hypothetical protein
MLHKLVKAYQLDVCSNYQNLQDTEEKKIFQRGLELFIKRRWFGA